MVDNLAAEEAVDTYFESQEQDVAIEVRNVGMMFNIASEQLNSLKEVFIALARREIGFKEFWALKDISFTVNKGDVFGILGTNGSGKSTLLKIVAGVLDPTKGSCVVNGKIAPLIELGAGFDVDLTARENIYLNGALLGYSKSFIAQNFEDIVEFAEIRDFLDMPLKNYSSGMVARIAFAIATVMIPDVLIVDEVLSVGDFMFQQKCERRIAELIKEHGVTVLIVSHSSGQVARLCNKAVWIEKGDMKLIGDAKEVSTIYEATGGRKGSQQSKDEILSLLQEDSEQQNCYLEIVNCHDHSSSSVRFIELDRSEKAGRSRKAAIVSPVNLMRETIMGSSLAGLMDAELMTVNPSTSLNGSIRELSKMKPNKIVCLDTGCGVEELLSSFASSFDFETEIVNLNAPSYQSLSRDVFEFGKSVDSGWGDTAILLNELSIASSLCISPASFVGKMPVFFTELDGTCDQETVQAIANNFKRLLVLGDGFVKLTDDFIELLGSNGVRIEKIAGTGPEGDTRAATKWSDDFMRKEAGQVGHEILIATNPNLLESATSGVYAARNGASIVMGNPSDLDVTTEMVHYVLSRNGEINGIVSVGDESQFGSIERVIITKAICKAKS